MLADSLQSKFWRNAGQDIVLAVDPRLHELQKHDAHPGTQRPYGQTYGSRGLALTVSGINLHITFKRHKHSFPFHEISLSEAAA